MMFLVDSPLGTVPGITDTRFSAAVHAAAVKRREAEAAADDAT